jgi:short-subunit dehydrogenase
MSQATLLLGATSGIAKAIAYHWAKQSRPLILAARDSAELSLLASDLRLRFGATVVEMKFDALDFDEHHKFFQQCTAAFPEGLEGVIITFGAMLDQDQCQKDFASAKRVIDTNYSAAVSLCELAAAYLEQRKCGYLCGVSSVAGDRGRQSNYIYGSSKAAFSTYLQGLRNRLFKSNVSVITVKPGFVDTPMTWGLISSPLMISPAKAAADICKAIDRRRDVIYTPFFWRLIMLIIRCIPEQLFKRLKL